MLLILLEKVVIQKNTFFYKFMKKSVNLFFSKNGILYKI